MSFSEQTAELSRSFDLTRELLQRLLRALEERRTAWVSVRPDVLAPSDEIEGLSRQLAIEDDRRATLLGRLRNLLPNAGSGRRGEVHVNVTRIAAELPPAEGRALRASADEVQKLARAVRAEVTLGQRLLQFAQRAQQSWLSGIAPALTTTRNGYDRSARGLLAARGAGQLIDGRM